MKRLGILALRDLIGYFPRTYEDRTQIKRITDLVIGETVCVRAMAATPPQLSHIRSGLDLVKLRAVDDSGSLDITFFNQNYIKDSIAQGETFIFYGKVSGNLLSPSMSNPLFEREAAAGFITGRLVPVYPLTAGLSQKIMLSAIRFGLDMCGDELPDILPEDIIVKHELCRARFAYESIHFPEDEKALAIARRRLIFEELFLVASAMKLLRARRGQKNGRSLLTPSFDEFYKSLAFEPTNAQARVISEASRDMAMNRPMNRLVQGDVGSGKTLVAAACCWSVWRSGCQSAFMAPTEILAKQHFSSLSSMLEPFGMKVGLITGSMTAKSKRDVCERLSCGDIDLVIGTHALISENVEFSDLALVVTDEQHRFGVNQRSLLTEKGNSPHVMVMSATPIPRTLALIIYGDLDVSIIDEMPPGRRPIKTFVVDESYRSRINSFIAKLVGEGCQVYVICPMVEEGENLIDGIKSAQQLHNELQNDVFPNLRTALVHGKMKTKDKDAAMSAFSAGEADILVATTVVEVGVDVPNAALIVIENADRFGLSQLHQLRGRVGRGDHESFCVLFRGGGGDVSRERLDVMKSTGDGFKIAEEDLKLRGPGDFFGSRQHGLPDLRIANFVTDLALLRLAQEAANEVMDNDPDLSKDENKKILEQITRLFEINSDKLQ